MRPIGTPQEKTASAVARFPCGNRSAIIEWPAGPAPASPIATLARARRSWGKLTVSPQIAVAALQNASDPAMMFFREALSASRAMGRPAAA